MCENNKIFDKWKSITLLFCHSSYFHFDGYRYCITYQIKIQGDNKVNRKTNSGITVEQMYLEWNLSLSTLNHGRKRIFNYNTKRGTKSLKLVEEGFRSIPILYCIVLYCIVLMGWSLLRNALRPFKIYCAPPNLGIRTWICRIILLRGLFFF